MDNMSYFFSDELYLPGSEVRIIVPGDTKYGDIVADRIKALPEEFRPDTTDVLDEHEYDGSYTEYIFNSFDLDKASFEGLLKLVAGSRYEMVLSCREECFMRRFFNDSDPDGTDEQFGHFYYTDCYIER